MKILMVFIAVALLAAGSALNRPKATLLGAVLIVAGLIVWVLALYPAR